MNQPLCADLTCSNAWAEHDAHDGRPTREPTAELCADPECPMAWAEHAAHAAGGSQ